MKTKYFAFTGDNLHPLEGAETFEQADSIADTIQKQGEPVFYIFNREQLSHLVDKASFILNSK